MHPRTLATFDQLYEKEWFRNIGAIETSVEVLDSWDKAIESCGSLEWEGLCLEATNQYCERLVERSPEKFNQWNDTVSAIKPIVQALVEEKTELAMREFNLPKIVYDTVFWDILHLGMESEYADIFPPGFYASLAFWYDRGHFPCGWRGAFPDGRLIVY